MRSYYFLVALAATIFMSCNDDTTVTPDDQDQNNTTWSILDQGQTDTGGMDVTLYSRNDLQTGYQKLQLAIEDVSNASAIVDAEITLFPLMDMGSMMHSAPVENPDNSTNSDGRFEGAVVFQMPGTNNWTLKVTVKRLDNGLEGEVTFPIQVAQSESPSSKVFIPADSSSPLIVTWVKPENPVVGVNDLEWTIHKRESMMSFPPVENFQVTIDPQMPSMSHGSPNNVDPVHTADGHYSGKVNFTMTGDWRIHFDIMDGAHVVDSTRYFDIMIP